MSFLNRSGVTVITVPTLWNPISVLLDPRPESRRILFETLSMDEIHPKSKEYTFYF